MVVDPIVANPVAGTGEFNISGQIVSDNGSGLVIRECASERQRLVFHQRTALRLHRNGWRHWCRWLLERYHPFERDLAAGTHLMEATFIPNVNYYVGSQNNSSFDSRGFSVMNFIVPSLTVSVNLPSTTERSAAPKLTSRCCCGTNHGLPMANQSVVVSTSTSTMPSPVQITVLTAANGSGGNLTVPADTTSVQPASTQIMQASPARRGSSERTPRRSSSFSHKPRSKILHRQTVLVAGDTLVVNGTLLDDLGMVLKRNGENATAIVHLLIDGVPVASVETDNMTGAYTLTYTLPEDTAAGPHVIGVEFRGGREWSTLWGTATPNNPEYYMPSSATVDFNVSVPTKILL